jgi:hypothetical protein
MTTFGRIFRQLFAGALFFILAGGTMYWSYQKIFPTLPNCRDGIQNQDETGVDCGGICEIVCPLPPRPSDAKEIEIQAPKAVNSGVSTYDLAAKIVNPNKYWGLESFNYEFNVKDGSGKIVLIKTGKSYLLPDSYDYIILSSQKIDAVPVDIELKLSEEKWSSVNADYNISALSFPVMQKLYTPRDENGFPSASGIVVNGTSYDFDKIDIKIALYGDNGDLLAVNALDMRTMLARDERYFRSIWDTVPAAAVANTDFVVTANIFDSANFMRRYGTGDKVQPYR